MTRSVAPPRSGPVPSAARAQARAASELLRTTAAMAVLGVVVPLLVVDWTRNTATAVNLSLAVLVVLISAARLSRMIGTGRPDLVRAFFYLFVYIFLGLAALAQTVSGEFPQDERSYAPDVITEGLVVVLTGIVAYEVGWALWRRRTGSAPAASDVPGRVRWYVSRPRVVVLGLFALGSTVYQVGVHGLASFFLSRSETAGLLTGAQYGNQFYLPADKAAGLITVFVTQVPLFIALFLALYCRHHRLWPKPRSLVTDALWRFFVGLLVVANIIINNPIGNARFWFCLVAVAVVSVYLRYTRPAAVRTYIVLALGILLLVFTALDAFRNSDQGDFSITGPGTTLVSDQTYGMFQMELNGVEYLSARDHTLGRQLLGSALGFVPRSLWESKPIATGQLIDPQYARAAPLWTEFQVDFGLAGVLVGFVVVGAVSAAVTRRATFASPGVLHALVPLFAVFQIFLLRGSLLPATGQLYQLLLVLALVVGVRRLAGTEPDTERNVRP